MTDHADQTLDETLLTPPGPPQSPFLPGTNIQFAWDSTSLGLFKTCPRLYQYTMIDGWQSRDESVHLRFGIEYHAALEEFDRSLALHLPRDEAIRSMVRSAFARTRDWDPDRSTKAGKYKNPESLIGLLVDYLDHFNPDPATTYIKADGTAAVELSFRIELDYGPSAGNEQQSKASCDNCGKMRVLHQGWAGGMETWQCAECHGEQPDAFDEPPQPYLLCGHLDRVVSFNSQLFVMDRKTTITTLGAYYFAQYNPHNQMSLYTLAGRIILDAPIHGVIIDAAQIKLEDPNAFARGFTYRTEAQLQEWQADLQATLSLAEIYAANNYWPMNDTSCDKFGGCRFQSICSADPHVRGAFLKSDFNKLEEQFRWNPLKAR